MTRSASREIEEATKVGGRARRQASIASNGSVQDVGARTGGTLAKSKKAQKAAVIGMHSDRHTCTPEGETLQIIELTKSADLETVEELDTQIADDDAPQTPPRTASEAPLANRSPSALSEMSGTTAISSFSMAEADLLESRFILRHLPRLYQDTEDFLAHLVPHDGEIADDFGRMTEMQKPDSTYVADYVDYSEELARRLTHFRAQHQQYINVQAVQRALFGANRGVAAMRSGLNMLMYLANIVILSKNMIHSDRSDKNAWDTLRQLDNNFPTLYLAQLHREPEEIMLVEGDSGLLKETFELALDLRTQLAILFIGRESEQDNFDPESALEEVFFESTDENDDQIPRIRGWNAAALGGKGLSLQAQYEDAIVERIKDIRNYLPTYEDGSQPSDTIDFEGLEQNFPWNSMVLRLLGWVRLRAGELHQGIVDIGGIGAIADNVNRTFDAAVNTSEETATNLHRESPRQKRASFGKYRRRSSQKFNPNTEVNPSILDRLIAKGKAAVAPPSEAEPVPIMRETPAEEQTNELLPETEREPEPEASAQEALVPVAPEDPLPDLEEDDPQGPVLEEEVVDAPTSAVDEPSEAPPVQESTLSEPPQSTLEYLQLLRQGKKLGKENSLGSFFQRQSNAQRVGFGDGFDDDSQAAPGPSQGAGPAHPRASGKRRRALDLSDDEDEEDDDLFVSEGRHARVTEQRAKAKRVRIDPTPSEVPAREATRTASLPSSAPPSHQPDVEGAEPVHEPRRVVSRPAQPAATQDTPPVSTFRDLQHLARLNTAVNVKKPVQARSRWTLEEENALIAQMRDRPRQYASILVQDGLGDRLLQDRTQVHLKDKARNMAIAMIK